MKNTKEFYSKLADLMDEYGIAGFYPSCDESVYIELPNNETKYFCDGVEPKYLREEAGRILSGTGSAKSVGSAFKKMGEASMRLRLRGDDIGEVKPLAIGKGVKVTVNGKQVSKVFGLKGGNDE